jgi:pyrroloquinoline quinone (PQQ) biosynthesis protein C
MEVSSSFETIYSEWQNQLKEVRQLAWFKRIQSGEIELPHYKGYLLETYHNTRYNPQLQAFTTMYMKPNHDIVRSFYRHATSEIGHDHLALNDLSALGTDITKIISSRPLPETVALTAFALFQIQFQNPICYLGYLFHLEFMPTQYGEEYITILKRKGIPDNALTFIDEHSKVDEGHNKLMKKYILDLVKTPTDLEEVVYSVKAACKLHGHMICAALEHGEKFFA